MKRRIYTGREKKEITKKIIFFIAVIIIFFAAVAVLSKVAEQRKAPSSDTEEASEVVEIHGIKCTPKTNIRTWLFIGAEYAIPISKEVKNAKRNVPLGMMIGLFLIFIMQSVMVLGFHNYVEWDALAGSAAPHLVYGYAVLGKAGKIWMMLVGA